MSSDNQKRKYNGVLTAFGSSDERIFTQNQISGTFVTDV